VRVENYGEMSFKLSVGKIDRALHLQTRIMNTSQSLGETWRYCA
jgi:hypothetical protein